MIKGVHTMFYSTDAEATRAFLRDVLGFHSTDVGDGWLIFDMPEADMGCHPVDPKGEHGKTAGAHDISFYCDDIHVTVSALTGRGVEFVGDIIDAGFGHVTHFKMPGGITVQLYEPKYTKNSAS